MTTQREKWRQICRMCGLLQYTLYGKTIKGKISHKKRLAMKRKSARAVNHFLLAAGYCFQHNAMYKHWFQFQRNQLDIKNVIRNIVKPAHLHWCRRQKPWPFTPTPVLYVCMYPFAMSTHVCNVLSIDFVEKPRFECCFWSVQCIETQARTSDKIKISVFFVQCTMMEFYR